MKTKLPGYTQKLAMIDQHLAVYSETEEVAKILKEMLDDIEQRLKIIDTVDEQANKLVEDTEAKMVEWEKQLVALSNAADKAKEKQASAQLEREKLNGGKKVADTNYKEEKSAYTLMVRCFLRASTRSTVALLWLLYCWCTIIACPIVPFPHPASCTRHILTAFCLCADSPLREGDLRHHHDQDQDRRAL